MGVMKTYKCKDNDVVIDLIKKDGILDEIRIGVEGDSSCGKTVVSAHDLNAAIHKHLTRVLTDFQLGLNEAGLIPDALWDYERVAKRYVKANFKNYKTEKWNLI